jgi:hypothetical protein
MTTSTKKQRRRLIKAIVDDAGSLRETAIESASVDGLHGLPDNFTSAAAAQLRAVCHRILERSSSTPALSEQEKCLLQRKSDADMIVNAYRNRYEASAGKGGAAGVGSWRRPLTAALLAVMAGLGLWSLGLVRDGRGVAVVACAGLIVVLNQHRTTAWAAHLRDFVVYRRAAWQLARIHRSLERNRGEQMEWIATRDWTERLIDHHVGNLAGVYTLYRGRAERAATLSQAA